MSKRMSVRQPRVDVPLKYTAHGHSPKHLIVLHETVSGDYKGLADITGVANYLAHGEYGIHMIVDEEGNSASVAPAEETAIYWHASSGALMVNTNAIGIEQVSMVKGMSYWWKRPKQLHKTARWLAYLALRHGIPIKYDPTATHGICGHWDVTRAGHVAGGHTDCDPTKYPTRWVVNAAKVYARLGWA